MLSYGAGIGYDFTKNFSTEVSAHNRQNFKYISTQQPSEKQDLASTSVMLSGYYAIDGVVSPYIMAGAGVAFNRAGDYSGTVVLPERTISSFAWQVGAGIKVKAYDNWYVNLGYKYVDSGLFTTKAVPSGSGTTGTLPVEGKLKTHEVTLGVTYKFQF